MVRAHQENLLRKGRRVQVEESFVKLVQVLELVSVQGVEVLTVLALIIKVEQGE